MIPRKPNSYYRTREHLVEAEVARLIEAAHSNRDGRRDACMILTAYRHGLRASEICDLRWPQVDFESATMHVNRLKHGRAATHPILPDELAALRRLPQVSPYVFVSERGTPFTPAGFGWLIKRAGRKAALSFSVHAHMLRHACGFKLANDGHDTRAIQSYIGHRNIEHTVRYCELAPNRFKNFWRGVAVIVPSPANNGL
jgi:type 1 fimbriae regulatory protein FimB/type 1 fimbriae regulatory protein FimE